MASSVAARLITAKGLSEDSELCIGMRAQHWMQLAPEAGGGRVTEVRQVGKIRAEGVGPSDVETAVEKFAMLVATL
eukprot:6213314-Pleurochrysis_carterae.AAC.2